jgi:hypothetical protein
MSDAAFEIVNAFVAAPKKERLLTLLGTKKGRAKVRAPWRTSEILILGTLNVLVRISAQGARS